VASPSSVSNSDTNQFSLDFDDDSETAATTSTVELTLPQASPIAGLVLFADFSSISLDQDGEAKVIRKADIGEIKDWLEDETKPKIVHDYKQLISFFATLGITLRGVTFDSMLASYLLAAGRNIYRLDDIGREHFGAAAERFGEKSFATLLRHLEPVLREKLRAAELEELHDKMELPVAAILAGIEAKGVAVDRLRLGEVSIHCQKRSLN